MVEVEKFVDKRKGFARTCRVEVGGWDSASVVVAKFAMFACASSSEGTPSSIGIVMRAWRRVQRAKHVNTVGQVLSECYRCLGQFGLLTVVS